jgi:glycosyltransferase involved in cell wall biosynthesis
VLAPDSTIAHCEPLIAAVLPDRPLISIVTIVRNGLPFVHDTIASVLSQDYLRLEYWIIDGGSNDGTIDVIVQSQQRLAGWVSELDRGIADAFNKGLAQARGDYVMFLNSDDALASSGAVTALVDAARNAGWPDVIYGDCDLIDRSTGAVLYRACIDYDAKRFLNFAMLPHPSMLVRRRYFERFGPFDTNFRIAMDYELLLRGVPGLGATRVPVLITNVRTGGMSTYDPIEVVDESIRALQKNGYGRSRIWAFRVRAQAHVRSLLRRLLEGLNLYQFARRLMGKPPVAAR